MKNVVLTRKALYELIWSTPIVDILNIYSITEDGIGRVCRSMGIPKPNANYWKNKSLGKNPKIEVLSDIFRGTQEVTPTTAEEEKTKVKRSKPKSDPVFRFPKTLSNPEKHVDIAQKSFSGRNRSYMRADLISTKNKELYIRLSQKNQAKVSSLKKRDHYISIFCSHKNTKHSFTRIPLPIKFNID